MFRFLVVSFACLALATHFVEMERMIRHPDYVQMGKASPELEHEVVIAVKQLNLDKLEKEVLERSTPGSLKFQKWLNFKEV